MILSCSVILHGYRGELGAPDSANNISIYMQMSVSPVAYGATCTRIPWCAALEHSLV